MTKNEFLKKLKRKISALPRAERNKALDYYSELIDDRIDAGFTEEAATAELGEVNAIADGVIAEAKERGVKMRMTGGWWIAGLLCGVACGVGLLLLGTHLISNWDDKVAPLFDRMGGEWIEKTAEFELAEGEGIYVELEDYDLFLGISEDGKVHFTYYENDVTALELSRAEKGVAFKQNNGFWHKALFFKQQRQAVIQVPPTFSGDIKISVAAGETRVDHMKTDGSLEISSAAGDVIMYTVFARGIDVSLAAGRLIMGDCHSFMDLTVVCSSGSAEIERSSAAIETGTFSLISAKGSVKLSECYAHAVKTNVTTGETELVSIGADSVSAETVTGSIQLDGLTANEIELSSMTGSITGKLAGRQSDYSITSSMSIGSNNLPSSTVSGERKLQVTVGVGDINITFAED